MRHVIMILAHGEIQSLIRFVSYFSQGCEIYIHLDKKYAYSQYELNMLRNMKGVMCISRKYRVNWGSYNMLLAEIELLRISYRQGIPCYYHLFSGLDYPLKPLWYFLDFFNTREKVNYIHCSDLKILHLQERLMQYQPYFAFPDRVSSQRKIDKLVEFQRKFGISRHINNLPEQMYIGSQWFSITDEAVGMILSEVDSDKNFLRRLNHTFAPEEIYINTLVRNLLPPEKVRNTNLRYIRWRYENGNCPANLDLSHLKYCLASGSLFARKFNAECSNELKTFIDTHLLNLTPENYSTEKAKLWIEEYFDYNQNIVLMIKKLVKILNVSSVLYPECGGCLFLDALIGEKVPVQGVDSSELSYCLSTAYNLSDYFQKADVRCHLECDNTFDMTMMVNCFSRGGLYENEMVVHNICNLTERYVLIIERECDKDAITSLENFVKRFCVSGFKKEPYISECCRLMAGIEYEIVVLKRC